MIERLGAAARGSRLDSARNQYGQLWMSVYHCDYAARPPFRRSVNRLLVRGESVHQLERAIHDGPIHGIDPYDYLVDVLQRVADHPASRVEELTPRRWKALFAQNPLRSDLHNFPC